MYVTRIPNRNSPPAILLRESYREDGKVKSRTLANLSKLPPPVITLVKRALKGETFATPDDLFEVVASAQHGNVQAVMDGDIDAFVDAFLRWSGAASRSTS